MYIHSMYVCIYAHTSLHTYVHQNNDKDHVNVSFKQNLNAHSEFMRNKASISVAFEPDRTLMF